ncbi:ATP-binding protein [Coleofasciculus sp.]|uniref:ATP-binding protein n=1 Tax=Coleofasciculus sp. TaxID=3100458 RepID=UPI003A3E41CC
MDIEQGIILIVDDNPTNLGVLSDCLSGSGFEVWIAQDGESAIERVDYAHPDIILLDVLMPGIDGFETCRQLKANPSTQDIPVIFMTALSDTVDKVKGFELGAVDYITKPVQHEEVLARVRTHLTMRKLTQKLQQKNACLKQEILERQQAQEALRQSEQRLQKLAKNVPGMLYQFCWRPDGSMAFPYVSPGCRQIYELEPEVIQENARVIIELIHPNHREYFDQSVAISAQTLQPWNWEGQIILPSGQCKWIQGAARPERLDNGSILWYGMVMDISKLKQAEAAISMALTKEKELNELKSRFVSMTSHEFRTPLTTILSSAQMLEYYSHKLTEEKKIIHLHRVQRATNQMIDMLNDMLVLGKAEAGKVEFNPTSLDLPSLCGELIEELQQGIGKGHHIEFTCEYNTPKTPNSIATCLDEKLVRHIIGNLLSNAIKYSPEESTVRLSLLYSQKNAIFTIQDQGIGIPETDQQRLFETFHRAANVGNIEGTGLGLAIVKNSVDAHGGTITLSSEVNVGTTFTVTLPLIYL